MKSIILLAIIFLPFLSACGQKIDDNTVTFFEKDEVKLYKTKVGDTYGIINQKEEVVLAHEYEEIRMFTKSLVCVKCPQKGYGLLSIDFKVVLPCQYENLTVIRWLQINGGPVPSSDIDDPKRDYILKKGFADSLYTFIDSAGTELSPNVFHNPQTMKIFNDVVFDDISKHKTRIGSRYSFIIKALTGEILLKDTLSNVRVIRSRSEDYLLRKGNTYLAVSNKDNKVALLDLQQAKLLTDFEYDRLSLPIHRNNEKPSLILGSKNGLYDVLNLNGESLSSIGFKEVQLPSNFNQNRLGNAQVDISKVEAFMVDQNDQIFALYKDKSVRQLTQK
ncbi:MAG: WG repeat-containing protein [Bacteroidia bacterium]